MTGLRCRNCGCGHLPVYRTVPLKSGKVRRERDCRNCGARVVTTEVPADGEYVPDVYTLTDDQRRSLWQQLSRWFL